MSSQFQRFSGGWNSSSALCLSGPESRSWLGARGELGLRLSVKENSCHSSQLFFLNIEFDTSHRLAASERLVRVESRAQISAWRWLRYLTALLIFLRRLAAFSHIFEGCNELENVEVYL